MQTASPSNATLPNEASCESALSEVVRQHGRLDVLVNNASVFEKVAATSALIIPPIGGP